MKVKVTNLLSAKLVIVGLGTVPASSTETFGVEPENLQGGNAAVSFKTMKELKRLEANGSCTFEIQLESGDVGLIAKKKLAVSFDAGDFTAAALTQTFTHADVFPTGARLLGGRVVVEELVTNSDGDFATSVVSALVSGPVALESSIDVKDGSGALGAVGFSESYVGLDLSGLQLKLTFTNTGAGANVALNTAGSAYVELLYSIV